jgi:LPXTG-motif cell wall-anchored protein
VAALKGELAKTGVSPFAGLSGFGFVALGVVMLLAARKNEPHKARWMG